MFAIDLIGYGYSDKPNPRELEVNPFYTFETWGSQLNDFCLDVVRDEAFFICNSIGGNYITIFSFSLLLEFVSTKYFIIEIREEGYLRIPMFLLFALLLFGPKH